MTESSIGALLINLVDTVGQGSNVEISIIGAMLAKLVDDV